MSHRSRGPADDPTRTTRARFRKRAAVAGGAVAAGGSLTGAATAAAHGRKGPPGGAGLHGHLNRVSHWDLNVGDLAKARTWYETATTLRVVGETSASQDFPSLGIRNGRFEGLLLRDPRHGPNAPAIHLVEWKSPKPVGTAYASYANVGWNALRNLVNGADASAAALEAVASLGTPSALPVSSFIRPPLYPGAPETDYASFAVRDYDGVYNQFVYARNFPAGPNTLGLVSPSTTNIDRYARFYIDFLGLDLQTGIGAPEAAPNAYGGNWEPVQFDGIFWIARGDSRITVDALEWTDTFANPTPYRSPVNRGIMRCSLQVDDVEECHRIATTSSWAKKRLIAVSRPEVWDMGAPFGARPVVEITDPDGVRVQLIEQVKGTVGLHPWGDIFPPAGPAKKATSATKDAKR
jgi:catechol 2,3-dioxygenase-like lactoylglutathione lyase family enzyme